MMKVGSGYTKQFFCECEKWFLWGKNTNCKELGGSPVSI